jgi:hypothetical protein
MVNICESVQRVVTRNECKWLTHSNQNGAGTGWIRVHTRSTQSIRSPAQSRHLSQRVLILRNMETLYCSHMGQQLAKVAYGNAGLGGWKKRMLCCSGADTGLNVTRCESKPTSDWSLFVRELVESTEWEKSK